MLKKDLTRLEARAAILKSLAHPSRLLIVEMLEDSPRCVGELRTAIGADITTVSKHLAVLKKAGLVRDRKRGTYSEYTLTCGCVSHFIDCIEKGMTGGEAPESPCSAPAEPSDCHSSDKAPDAGRGDQRYSDYGAEGEARERR